MEILFVKMIIIKLILVCQMVLMDFAKAGLGQSCSTIDNCDRNVHGCCAYANSNNLDTGTEKYFCLSQDEINANLANDGTYSEDGGTTKWYYLDCEQVHGLEGKSSVLSVKLMTMLIILGTCFI